MDTQDSFEEELPEDEPKTWHPPVRCPQCNSIETRFLTLEYEMLVYECEICGSQFEIEE